MVLEVMVVGGVVVVVVVAAVVLVGVVLVLVVVVGVVVVVGAAVVVLGRTAQDKQDKTMFQTISYAVTHCTLPNSSNFVMCRIIYLDNRFFFLAQLQDCIM